MRTRILSQFLVAISVVGSSYCADLPPATEKILVIAERNSGSEPLSIAVRENGRPISAQLLRKLDSEPRNIVLVIDDSGSANRNKAFLNAATRVFIATVPQFPRDRVALVHMNESAFLDVPFTNDASKFSTEAAHQSTSGGTALYDAVVGASKFAAQQAKSEGGIAEVVLISDGEENASRNSASESLKFISSTGVRVSALGMPTAGRGGDVLKDLCVETGGVFLQVHSGKDFTPQLTKMLTAWNESYLLELQVPASAKTGKPIGLKVYGPKGWAIAAPRHVTSTVSAQ